MTHYRGNYGNFLFLWDVMFGTAKITRRRPDTFGVEVGADPLDARAVGRRGNAVFVDVSRASNFFALHLLSNAP